MNKKIYFPLLLILLFFLYNCAGYEPIFSPTSTNFEIKNHNIEGNKSIGNNIYSKLNVLSKANKNNPNKKSIELSINASKDKTAFSKNSSGKILSYKITINIKVNIIDETTNQNLLNKTFINSQVYKVQDQYSDTVALENITIETLIEQTYEALLIQISEIVL